jgi:CelD/BcsL family acetyltransferase involved in cellulose biosynthesis
MIVGFDLNTIRDEQDFTALIPEWWGLWHRDPDSTPFQSPAWLAPWWRHFGRTGGALAVRTLRHETGRLAAILPLFHYDGPPAPRLLPLGAGNSDYLDGIFEPGLPPEAITALLAYGERIDLPGLSPEARLRTAPAPVGWVEENFPQEPCPTLPLPTVLPKSMAQNLRYYRRRAEWAGSLRFECAVGSRVPVLLDALFRLHRARWESRGEAGVLADPVVAAFHRDVTPALADAGLLRLFALHLALNPNDRPAAAFYGFTAKERAFYYLSGFDPERAALGLGTLVVGHAIEIATREGIRVFDFLRGGEDYKYRWGAVDRPGFGRVLRRRN